MADVSKKFLPAHMKRHGVVHLVWLVVILVGILICLLSVKLGTDNSVKDILNFAVALSSMLLALVAIVQAIVASGSMGDTIAEVHRAVSSISVPASRIENAAKLLEEHSTRVQVSSSQINDSIVALRETGFGGDKSATKARQDNFTPDIMQGAAPATKLTLYVVLRSYEEKLPYSDCIPSEDDETDSLEYYIRGIVVALTIGGVVGSRVEDDKRIIDDLGDLAWLKEHRSGLFTVPEPEQQHVLTSLLAKVDEKIAQLRSH